MKERDGGSVTITNLSSKAVKAFLDYAYTGKTKITDDNVEMFFQLSSFLQVSFLSKACSDFLIKVLILSIVYNYYLYQIAMALPVCLTMLYTLYNITSLYYLNPVIS